MMNPLTVFDFEDTVVRSLVIDNEPWFVGKDVCACLGISKYRDVLPTLDTDERGSTNVDTLGGKQEMTLVNECGLYHLIFRSRKPQAQRFRRWVLHCNSFSKPRAVSPSETAFTFTPNTQY